MGFNRPNNGYTLIEVVIAFAIAILTIPIIYQTLGTLSSRVYYLNNVSRETKYFIYYNNSVVNELKGNSHVTRSFYFELGSIKEDCEERYSESRYVVCPYRDFLPLNPYVDVQIPAVEVIVFNNGFYLLLPK